MPAPLPLLQPLQSQPPQNKPVFCRAAKCAVSAHFLYMSDARESLLRECSEKYTFQRELARLYLRLRGFCDNL